MLPWFAIRVVRNLVFSVVKVRTLKTTQVLPHQPSKLSLYDPRLCARTLSCWSRFVLGPLVPLKRNHRFLGAVGTLPGVHSVLLLWSQHHCTVLVSDMPQQVYEWMGLHKEFLSMEDLCWPDRAQNAIQNHKLSLEYHQCICRKSLCRIGLDVFAGGMPFCDLSTNSGRRRIVYCEFKSSSHP